MVLAAASTEGDGLSAEAKSPPAREAVRAAFPHLEILELVGQGGMGAVFYELLTGELPLGRFAPPSERASVDTRLDKVVLKALEKQPERRQQSAAEVRTQVQTIASHPHPGVPWADPGSPRHRGRLIQALSVADAH